MPRERMTPRHTWVWVASLTALILKDYAEESHYAEHGGSFQSAGALDNPGFFITNIIRASSLRVISGLLPARKPLLWLTGPIFHSPCCGCVCVHTHTGVCVGGQHWLVDQKRKKKKEKKKCKTKSVRPPLWLRITSAQATSATERLMRSAIASDI